MCFGSLPGFADRRRASSLKFPKPAFERPPLLSLICLKQRGSMPGRKTRAPAIFPSADVAARSLLRRRSEKQPPHLELKGRKDLDTGAGKSRYHSLEADSH